MLMTAGHHISAHYYPDKDANTIRVLNYQVSDLKSFAEDFAAALRLFDLCFTARGWDWKPIGTAKDLNAWGMIACRDGGMTIYHFMQSLEAIKGSLDKAPAVAKRVDPQWFERAKGLYDEAFPDAELLRHALAHVAELSLSLKSFNKHSFKGQWETPGATIGGGGGGQVFIGAMLNGRKFSVTRQGVGSAALQAPPPGAILSYEMSEASAAALKGIANNVFQALAPAAKPLEN